ncbi:hypothetical protein GCM10008171_32900 [Methylopila jiangsuensis]|uniref:Uncharacterized protein n=1 Tax=Methylopila jiangsuensis TaxID=586230 RepID=A0A9W6JKG1_9HYPH|nr:hypothetical protein [Methylopila jiangsuensis]MDR6284575.1 hypothetical protein [Methylopila jiangsuensis]GLK78036.1 hypothetical protein GCM10008171_32900 [Methylopila jiangsuensis]
MSIRGRVAPIDLDVRAILDEELSPAAQSRQLAAYAKEQLAEAQEINRRALGRVPDHATFVDGRPGGSVDAVRPDGTIVFAFEFLDDVFNFIAEELVQAAPFLTGEYRDSFFMLADGVLVPEGAAYPAAVEYAFLPGVPYARKIERGLSDQAPDGVFQVVAELASRRFGNLARIRFSYRSALLDYVALGGRKGGRSAAPAKRAAHAIERETRQPAIVVTERG